MTGENNSPCKQIGVGDEAGFSVVEFLVTAFVFSIVVIAVGGIFIQTLNLQRRGFGAQKVEENALFVFESMAKEIRVSTIEDQDANCDRTQLTVVHPVNGTVVYSLEGSVVKRVVGGAATYMSSADVQFNRFVFCVQGSGTSDNEQARVTILVQVQNKTNSPKERVVFDLQTTVSERDITKEIQN